MSSIKLKHSGGNAVSLNPPTSAPTSSEVAFKLPTADGSAGQLLMTDGSGNLSWFTPGITQADEWRVTANFTTANANIITTNWERNDNKFSVLGSGMSESSGIFTFPETGIYQINFNTKATSSNQQVRYVVGEIITTSNNFTSEGSAGFASQSISNDASADITANCSCLFDVTDTSTHKVKFTVYSEHSITWEGDSTRNRTYATFLRLGNT
jgi:hypothetical protein